MNKNDLLNKKLAISLGGGAARGAFHLGFLHFCDKNKITFDAFSGSSIGSIISASYASGVLAKEQLEIFCSKDIKKLIKFNYFKNGLFKIEDDTTVLDKLLPISRLEDIEKSIYINAYDLKKQKLHYFTKGNTVTLCKASSALIPMFKPISYKNMYLIDGGLFDNVPIKPLLDKNYHILSLDLFPSRNRVIKSNSFNLIKYLKKKTFTQLYENKKFTKKFTDEYITNTELLEFSLFTFDELHECFNLGFKEAENFFLDII
ncbi:MAG: patatin-like phospholipase family protein [Campylobacterota bacterium]